MGYTCGTGGVCGAELTALDGLLFISWYFRRLTCPPHAAVVCHFSAFAPLSLLFFGLLISCLSLWAVFVQRKITSGLHFADFSHFALPTNQTHSELIQVDYYGLGRQLKLTSACCHKRHILVFNVRLAHTTVEPCAWNAKWGDSRGFCVAQTRGKSRKMTGECARV